jgi:hypothetical protein
MKNFVQLIGSIRFVTPKFLQKKTKIIKKFEKLEYGSKIEIIESIEFALSLVALLYKTKKKNNVLCDKNFS